MSRPLFENRRQAGQALGERLRKLDLGDRPLVLALVRGGLPVAYEAARAISADLDILLVRKIGVPDQPELAMGAVAEDGRPELNSKVIEQLSIRPESVERAARQARRELEERRQLYRGNTRKPDIEGRVVIVVDDGLATGATALAAVRAVREQRPAKLIMAVPVGAPDACEMLGEVADEVVCVETPRVFGGVSAWYQDFDQVSDAEVVELLQRAPSPTG